MSESTAIYRTFSEAWVTEVRKTLVLSPSASPRGMATKERTFVQFEVLYPMSFPVRAEGRIFRDTVGYLEGLSNIAQVNVPIAFTDRVRNFNQFTDDGVFWGAYGARLHGQIGDLVKKLQSDPDTRQAVMTIFNGGKDLSAAKRDIPCTVMMQFLLRDGELGMRVTMRSNDLWLGTPYDFTQFAILQATIAQALGVQPGVYVHSVGSLHLYERDWEKAADIDFPKDSGSMPFPLWNAWGDSDLKMIVERAQRLLLAPHTIGDKMTTFEMGVYEDLHIDD